MGAETRELDVGVVGLLPRVELLTHEEDRFPERAAGSCRTTALDLDYGSGDLYDAGVEVNRSPRRQMIRPAFPVHHLLADDLARATECVLGFYLHSVHDHGEFGFHADCRELDPLVGG